MVIKFSLLRLSIILLIVIFFPLVQNQWLNLYLFDLNSFSFYKFLYYLSGLICPILVCTNSLSKFTNYKFDNNKKVTSDFFLSGKLLLILTSLLLSIISTLIYKYIFLNFKLISNWLITDNNYLFNFGIHKQIFLIVTISILLLFKKSKLFIKKAVLLNFFIFSIILWFLQINNILVNDSFLIHNFLKLENMNFINIVFLLSIESLYYLWSYISFSTYLSDWNVPYLKINELIPLIQIIMFYLLIALYYSILFN